MSAFFLIDVQEITDEAKMAEYREKVFPVVERFGGKYRVVGGEQYVLEGEWKATFPVLIEFETVEQARRWYDAPEYRELRALRLAATRGTNVLIDGAVNSLAN
jgi:uncharacterized protein (DUF1330 family)